MQFHGNPIPAEEDPMFVWRIKSPGNEEARQQFLDGYVPQIRELGLTSGPALRKDEERDWHYTEPDWESSARSSPATAPPRRSASQPAAVAGRRGLGRAGGAGGGRAIFEVFRQERKGQPFQHAGSVSAPDEAFAEVYARGIPPGARNRSRSGSCRASRWARWRVPRRGRDEVPPRGRLLDQGAAARGARAGGHAGLATEADS